MPKTKRLTAVLLTVILLITAGGCAYCDELESSWQQFTAWFNSWPADKSASEQNTDGEDPSEEEPVYTTSIRDADTDYILPYARYDSAKFYDLCDQIRTLAQQKRMHKSVKLFEKLLAEYDYIVTMDVIASVLYMEDASSGDLQAEADYMDALATDAYDQSCTIGHELATGPLAKQFRLYVDEETFQFYVDYEPLSEEELALTNRETELVNQYYVVMDSALTLPYTSGGKTYTMEEIYDDDTMEAMDYDLWYEVYEGCLKALCEKAGPIYTELVQVRDSLARLNGYANYAQYADETLYSRDYTTDDLKPLKQSAKALQMNYTDYAYAYQNLPQNDGNLTVLMAQLQSIADQCSPYASEACHFLRKNKLYSIGSEDCRFDQGYTTCVFLPDVCPFIYYKACNSSYDLCALVHELGHFTKTYKDEDYNFLTESLDLAEIHSSGLQMLASVQYESVSGKEDAALLNAFQLYEAIDSIVTGCVYDDWQRAVFETPDMSLDDICECFRQTQTAYGKEDHPGAQYEWLMVPHNFNLPMYYVSYATSAVEALQIWQIAQTDYDRAVGIWQDLIDYTGAEESSSGPLPETFTEVLVNAGLKPFNDQEAVDTLLKEVLATIKKDALTGRLLN